MRYLIRFSYDGTLFYGYQAQEGLRTVEGQIEKAVSFINKKTETIIYASGRTDKGVHASNQTAHFDLINEIEPFKIKSGLNSMLSDDIYIKEVKMVDDDFHARYSVKSKEYKYFINMGEYNPLERNYCYQYCKKLDIDKMISALKLLEGKHDFRSFIASDANKNNTIRTLFSTSIEENDNIITITFIGDGFMKYQIRNMVGILISIGEGKTDKNVIDELFKLKDSTYPIKTASSCGLILEKVNY